MPSGIYEIVNTVNGRRYVGSAAHFDNRWRSHRSKLNSGRHHSRHLQHAWNKHGMDVFTFNRLVICDKKNLILYEQLAIGALSPEYNVTQVAANSFGWKLSEETKAKIAAKAVGRKWSPEAIAKLSATTRGRKKPPEHSARMIGNKRAAGVVFSPERRAQISLQMTGMSRPKSAEQRRKISESLKGIKHSAERRAVQAAGQVGLKRKPRGPMSAETKARMAFMRLGRTNPLIGRKRPPEVIEKMRKALMGRQLSQAHAASIAAASKRMWADPDKRKVILESQRKARRLRKD